jgi:hypothetical protein
VSGHDLKISAMRRPRPTRARAWGGGIRSVCLPVGAVMFVECLFLTSSF